MANGSNERLLSAAADFCRHDEVIRALRKQLRPCIYFDPGDDDKIGDTSTPACDLDPANPDRCGPCEQRAKWKPVYLKALRGRQAAKRKMTSAFKVFSPVLPPGVGDPKSAKDTVKDAIAILKRCSVYLNGTYAGAHSVLCQDVSFIVARLMADAKGGAVAMEKSKV